MIMPELSLKFTIQKAHIRAASTSALSGYQSNEELTQIEAHDIESSTEAGSFLADSMLSEANLRKPALYRLDTIIKPKDLNRLPNILTNTTLISNEDFLSRTSFFKPENEETTEFISRNGVVMHVSRKQKLPTSTNSKELIDYKEYLELKYFFKKLQESKMEMNDGDECYCYYTFPSEAAMQSASNFNLIGILPVLLILRV